MQVWLRRLAVLGLAYFLLRLLFCWHHSEALSGSSGHDIFLGFLQGARFDVKAILLLNSPLMLFHGLRYLQSKKTFRDGIDAIVSSAFIIVNGFFLALNVIDLDFYGFTGKRLTLDLLSIRGDVQGQALGILAQYWTWTFATLFAVGVISWTSWQRPGEKDFFAQLSPRGRTLTALLFLSLCFLGIRGGLQVKPLAPSHAFALRPAALANMAMNSTVTVLLTQGLPEIKPLRLMEPVQMQAILRSETPDLAHLPLVPGNNVVVIILESFAAEYIGALNGGVGYTPFLDELIQKSLSFRVAIANGRRSIDAMPSILAGIPSLSDLTLITSPFASNRLVAVPEVLHSKGYVSGFFHGAQNGSMHFDTFAAMAGFDRYVGLNEYRGAADDTDGQWGVFDEPFLQFVAQDFTAWKEPFFATIFTLSSHNPFKVPRHLQGKFPQGNLPIHESIGYADYALRQFFDKARTMPWFQRTVFILTADHTSLSNNHAYQNDVGRHRVPLLIYDPLGRLPAYLSDRVAQHLDIPATIYDLLGIEGAPVSMLSRSLINPSLSGRAINQENGLWWMLTDKEYVTTGERGPTFFTWQEFFRPEPLADPLRQRALQDVIDASRQYYINGLLNDAWYPNLQDGSK